MVDDDTDVVYSAGTEQTLPETQPESGAWSLSDDVLSQTLAFLPLRFAVRMGAVSRGFSKAALACVQNGIWQEQAASDDGGRQYIHQHENWRGEGGIQNFGSTKLHQKDALAAEDLTAPKTTDASARTELGTPCLDLRGVGSKIDDAVLDSILFAAFRPAELPSHEAAPTVSKSPAPAVQMKVDVAHPAVRKICNDPGVSPAPTSGERNGDAATVDGGDRDDACGVQTERREEQAPVLRGLAVSSVLVTDEGVQKSLESHGYGLQVLSLDGCCALECPRTIDAMRGCTNLVKLNLCSTRLRLLYEWPPPARGTPIDQWNRPNEPSDEPLRSLLSVIGHGLVSLRLFGCTGFGLRGIATIADTCPVLRELDVGIVLKAENGPMLAVQPGREMILQLLGESACGSRLEYLGLRGQDREVVAGLLLALSGIESRFGQLRRLDLAGVVKLDDAKLATVSSKLSLTHIDVSGCCGITNKGVVTLAQGSPDLEWISLHGTKVTDSGVQALCESCPVLRNINLSLTSVTGQCIRFLRETESLRWINLRCCDKMAGPYGAENAADLRCRLAARGPRYNRGVAFIRERPQGPKRARPSRQTTDDARSNGSRGERAFGNALEVMHGYDDHASRFQQTSTLAYFGGSDDDAERQRPAEWNNVTSTRLDKNKVVTTWSTERMELNAKEAIKDDLSVVEAPAVLSPSPGKSAASNGTQEAPQAWEKRGNLPTSIPSPPLKVSGKGIRLPPGVGDFSLGQRHRKEGARPRSADGTLGSASAGAGGEVISALGAMSAGGAGQVDGGGPGGGRELVEGPAYWAQTGIVPFDWDAVPRGGGLMELAAWRGFRGLPGDVAKEVILTFAPFSTVEFVPKGDKSSARFLPKSHRYQVHKNKYGLPWGQLCIDEQGCVA